MQSNENPTEEATPLTKENLAEIVRVLNAPRISVDYSGIQKRYKEILAYCDDWRNRTPDGLSLRLTQSNDCLFAIKTSLLEEDDIAPDQVKELNLLKGKFEVLREQIQNKADRDSFKSFNSYSERDLQLISASSLKILTRNTVALNVKHEQETDRLKRLEHYFTTTDTLSTGNARRDEHIFNLYQATADGDDFADVEDALYVFSLATGGLSEHRTAPLSAIAWLTNLFNEHSLTDSQRRIILTHLIAYTESTPPETRTISLNKTIRLMKSEENKLSITDDDNSSTIKPDKWISEQYPVFSYYTN